jgi:hypothetical protein
LPEADNHAPAAPATTPVVGRSLSATLLEGGGVGIYGPAAAKQAIMACLLEGMEYIPITSNGGNPHKASATFRTLAENFVFSVARNQGVVDLWGGPRLKRLGREIGGAYSDRGLKVHSCYPGFPGDQDHPAAKPFYDCDSHMSPSFVRHLWEPRPNQILLVEDVYAAPIVTWRWVLDNMGKGSRLLFITRLFPGWAGAEVYGGAAQAQWTRVRENGEDFIKFSADSGIISFERHATTDWILNGGDDQHGLRVKFLATFGPYFVVEVTRGRPVGEAGLQGMVVEVDGKRVLSRVWNGMRERVIGRVAADFSFTSLLSETVGHAARDPEWKAFSSVFPAEADVYLRETVAYMLYCGKQTEADIFEKDLLSAAPAMERLGKVRRGHHVTWWQSVLQPAYTAIGRLQTKMRDWIHAISGREAALAVLVGLYAVRTAYSALLRRLRILNAIATGWVAAAWSFLSRQAQRVQVRIGPGNLAGPRAGAKAYYFCLLVELTILSVSRTIGARAFVPTFFSWFGLHLLSTQPMVPWGPAVAWLLTWLPTSLPTSFWVSFATTIHILVDVRAHTGPPTTRERWDKFLARLLRGEPDHDREPWAVTVHDQARIPAVRPDPTQAARAYAYDPESAARLPTLPHNGRAYCEAEDGMWVILHPTVLFAKPHSCPEAMVAAMHRVLTPAPVIVKQAYIYLQQVAHALFPDYPTLDHMSTDEFEKSLKNARAKKNFVRARDRAVQVGKPPVTLAGFPKQNETIRISETKFNPRAVVIVDSWSQANLQPYCAAIALRMKQVFDGERVFELPELGIPTCTLKFGSGCNAEALSQWAQTRPPGIWSFIAAGDDSVTVDPLGCITEADFGKYDQSQGPRALQCEAILLQKLGMPADAMKFFYRLYFGEGGTYLNPNRRRIYASKKGFTFRADIRTMRVTGSPDTTIGNSLVNILAFLGTVKGRYSHSDLGFTVVAHSLPSIYGATFLRGWFVRSNSHQPIWLPLPGQLGKWGKICVQPARATGLKRGTYRDQLLRLSHAICSSWIHVPRQYPIVGAFLSRLERFLEENPGTHTGGAADLFEPNPYKVMVEDDVDLDVDFTYSLMERRYDIPRAVIVEAHQFLLTTPDPPCLYHHPAIERMAEVDY